MKVEGRRQKVEGQKMPSGVSEPLRRSHGRLDFPRLRFALAVLCFLPSTFYLLPSTFSQSPRPAPTPAPAATGFESYKFVRTRNVFDPDRRPLVKNQGTPPPAPIQQSDYIALTGTMLNADKNLAFFSGSRAEFNKVLAVRDSIANATITDINGLGVEVDRGGRKIKVSVGQTLPLDNSAPAPAPAPQPVVAAAAAAVTGASAPSTTATSTTSTTTTLRPTNGAAATPAAASDTMTAKQQEIMKRMMEKRKQDGLQ